MPPADMPHPVDTTIAPSSAAETAVAPASAPTGDASAPPAAGDA